MMARDHGPAGRVRAVQGAWLLALTLAALSVLLPAQGPGTAGWGAGISGYPADVAQNVYRMIRMAMPWLPAGMLASLVLPQTVLRLLVLVAVGAGATAALVAGGVADGQGLVRDLLAAVPAVAVGAWLADRSRLCARAPRVQARAASAPEPAEDAEPGIPTPSSSAIRHLSLEAPGRRAAGKLNPAPYLMPLLGLTLLGVSVIVALGFPRWALPLAVGLALYAALLWWRPAVAIVAVPVALPLLDLAPWTGRILLDEFDLVMAVSVGMAMLRRQTHAPLARAPSGVLPMALFLGCVGVSGVSGLLPLPTFDANAVSSYWSTLNALRVAKGVVWGASYYWIVRRTASGEASLVRLLGIGMGVGLLGVGLVGAWERWLYAGLTDEASTYRIVSTFSSMHTGGGHIEAYLVAAVPFLWLGLFRLRHLALALPVLVLSAYVTIYTVARGGVLAFVVITGILAVATLRVARGSGMQRMAAPLAALLGVTAIVVAGAGSGYLWQRFERSAEDWQTRVEHWRLALRMMEPSWTGQAFGSGLGSFPRTYLWQGPADRQPATYAFAAEQGRSFLRLGVGETLYVAQRVDVEGGVAYRLSLTARSRGSGGELSAPMCEKQLLNSRRCDWNQFRVPADGQWHTLTREFGPATVGQGRAWQHLPVELYFHHASNTGVIDITRVSLFDAQGRDLIVNGDFTRGADAWFFKTKSHLPWHIKNFWVHSVFEMGWLGALATALLVFVTLARLALAGWAGSRLAWALLASLAGVLTVGLFDSLLDAPRVATLLVAWLFLGSSLAWPGPLGQARPPQP